ncbi:MAG TPA: gamma-glutamyl-gamma-aminobutyrate hydrolase family protein [Planktothrix sp.]
MLYPFHMKPIIGLNCDVLAGPPEQAVIQANYYRAVQSAGGIPILLPPTPDSDLEVLLRDIAGLILIGGPDYCPSNYGEDPHETLDPCHPERDNFDLRLIKKALERSNVPILGICAGAQLLNISLGGTLIQHIWAENDKASEHRSKNGWNEGFTKHSVKLEPHTELASIYKRTDITVVSSHHQAIRKLGDGLTAVAWADDGIIEAVESKTRPFTIGVQWHPERDYDGNIALFSEFVKRCGQRR